MESGLDKMLTLPFEVSNSTYTVLYNAMLVTHKDTCLYSGSFWPPNSSLRRSRLLSQASCWLYQGTVKTRNKAIVLNAQYIYNKCVTLIITMHHVIQ